MKSILITFLVSLSLTLFANATDKYAFLICISEYQDSDWLPTSADNDLELYKKTLNEKGFDKSNVFILKDADAIKENVASEMYAMLSLLNEGDSFFMAYSGHGQLIEDDNNDEKDGWDESLVLYDAPAKTRKGYHGQRHLLDDEIHEFLRLIREKIGRKGQLLFVADACFSGTIERDDCAYRGTDFRIGINYSPFEVENAKSQFEELDTKTRRRDNISPIIVLSATMPNQRAEEKRFANSPVGDNKVFGVFTYNFCQYFMQANQKLTYNELYRNLKQSISNQEPYMSGAANEKVM